jgi:hypothetical protein
MAATFRDQRDDVLARGGAIGAARLWWDTIRGILTTAPREHVDLLRSAVRYALRGLRRNPAFTLVAIYEKARGGPVSRFEFSAPDYLFVRGAAQSFAGMFTFRNQSLELSGIGESQRVSGVRVASEMFAVLGAGLLARSFARLLSASRGFRPQQVATASVQLPSGRYPDARTVKLFYRQAVEALRAIPSVTAAAASTDRPLHIRERRTFSADATAVELPTG